MLDVYVLFRRAHWFLLVLVRSRLGLIQGQVISGMKEACRQGFLDWSPRLYLAIYTCDIQASGKAIYIWERVDLIDSRRLTWENKAEVLGRVYGVISKRKGKIVSEDLKDGTPFWQIHALLPVIESFGFSDGNNKESFQSAKTQLFNHLFRDSKENIRCCQPSARL